jgi:hypothetical protein
MFEKGSGAEDLLQWTDALWAEQRAARSKHRGISIPTNVRDRWLDASVMPL